jgi:hypothetical protein
LRQFIKQRGGQGLNVQEVNLRIPDNQTVLLMQRGAEGFFAVNMSASAFEIPSIDLTLTDLEGCYNELRNNCTVAIQRASNSKKYGTRWGDLQSGRHAATGKGCPHGHLEKAHIPAPPGRRRQDQEMSPIRHSHEEPGFFVVPLFRPGSL